MPTVSMPPVEEARDIFRDLGYTIDGDGSTLRAERKWRTVEVTAVASDANDASLVEPASDVRFRCFVTWEESVGSLRTHLSRTDPNYEWAIIGVTPNGDYDVVRADEVAA
jgi:hypothetical protein